MTYQYITISNVCDSYYEHAQTTTRKCSMCWTTKIKRTRVNVVRWWLWRKRDAYGFRCEASPHVRLAVKQATAMEWSIIIRDECARGRGWRHTSVHIGVLLGSDSNGMRREFCRSSVCYGSPAQRERVAAAAAATPSDLTTYLCVFVYISYPECRQRA